MIVTKPPPHPYFFISVRRRQDKLYWSFHTTYLYESFVKYAREAPEQPRDSPVYGVALVSDNAIAYSKTWPSDLKQSRQQAINAGLKPTIYTHPLGYHGHGAGATLGMWDSQGGVAGSGDYPLQLDTSYAIELNNAVYIDEWNKEIRIMLEEGAHFDVSGVWYLDGRQTELLLVE